MIPPDGQMALLQGEFPVHMLAAHSAFLLNALRIGLAEPGATDEDLLAATQPIPVNLDSDEDCERALQESLAALGAAIDSACVDHLAAHLPVDDITLPDLRSWLAQHRDRLRASLRVRCGIEVYTDTRLDHAIDVVEKSGVIGPRVDFTTFAYTGNDDRYVIIAPEHTICLAERISIQLATSEWDGAGTVVTANAEFPYQPRLDLHGPHIRIARVHH